ncbi:hypothetical protein SALBM217S_04244 [Streptomyces griseoloalbus]
MTQLATMEFHPRPQAGEAKPWAFPAPERGALDNGLTVLRCHRPGQQVVAVEVCLYAPLDAEPEGLDGVATIMARAFSEGTDKHSAEEFAAELERCGATLDAHADHPGVRLSLEVPASRLAKGLGLVADALRAPAFADSEIERLVRNRLDEIPHELANPSRRAAKELSKELFPASARMFAPAPGHRGDRRAHRLRGRARLLREAWPPGHGYCRRGRRPHRRRPGRAARRHPGRLDRLAGPAAARPAGGRGRHRARGDRGPARRRADAAADRPDRPGPARPGVARAGARHVLPGRHPHLAPGPRPARGEGIHLRRTGVRPGVRRAARRHGRGDAGHQRLGRHPRTPARRWTTCGPCCARWPARASPTRSATSPCRTWWVWRRWEMPAPGAPRRLRVASAAHRRPSERSCAAWSGWGRNGHVRATATTCAHWAAGSTRRSPRPPAARR